ncbi:MAG: OmpA family protein [Gammaproteobacteria bacterium]|nr:OmpA family protein [Gammaproteobacteria bacterium]
MKYITFIYILFSSFVHADQFQAPLTDTQWQVIESPLECTLTQSITDFGEAKFSRQTGGQFSLTFTTKSYPATQSNIRFEIAQAPWQNSEERLHLISLPSENNQTTFILSGELAKQALTHMQEGRFPTIRYRSHNASEEVSALLSTVHLTDSMPAFQQCLNNLHPDTFEDIRKLTLYFGLEDAKLSANGQAALCRIADYVKIDSSVKRIDISGHTDNHGRRRLNIPLSEARALSVKNHLIEECKISENMITTSFHREFIPSTTNKTKSGRAHNRRAEINVIR